MHKISNRIFEIFFKKTLDFLLAGFRLADMIEAFQFVLDTPKCYGKSPNGQQRTDATGVPPQLSF